MNCSAGGSGWIGLVRSASATLSARCRLSRGLNGCSILTRDLVQVFRDVAGDKLCELDGNGVPDLPHALGPRCVEDVFVWEGLDPCRFSNRKIPQFPVTVRERVLSTGYAVDASLESLRG